jgi:hypothetical protein
MTWLRPVDRTSGTLTLSAGTLSCLAHHGTPLSKRCPTTTALERTIVPMDDAERMPPLGAVKPRRKFFDVIHRAQCVAPVTGILRVSEGLQVIFKIWRRCRVEQEGDSVDARCHLLEQLQPLATHGAFDVDEPGDVAARLRQARNEAAADRIGNIRKNNGDSAGLTARRALAGEPSMQRRSDSLGKLSRHSLTLFWRKTHRPRSIRILRLSDQPTFWSPFLNAAIQACPSWLLSGRVISTPRRRTFAVARGAGRGPYARSPYPQRQHRGRFRFGFRRPDPFAGRRARDRRGCIFQ